MTQPPITPYIHEALDIQGDLGSKPSLDLIITLQNLSENIDFFSGEIVQSSLCVDA